MGAKTKARHKREKRRDRAHQSLAGLAALGDPRNVDRVRKLRNVLVRIRAHDGAGGGRHHDGGAKLLISSRIFCFCFAWPRERIGTQTCTLSEKPIS